MRKLLLFATLACAPTIICAQEREPIYDAGIVTCDSSTSAKPLHWVESSSGNAAAVELAVSISGSDDSRHCITSWKLHVRAKGSEERTLAVAERDDTPEDDEWVEENSFGIDAWSKDGTMVLTSQIEAQGDWDETTPIVFDFRTNIQYRVELYPLFKNLISRDCYVVYRALGFSDDGGVLISAMSTDDDREPGTKACFPESRWRLDFRQSRISPVSPRAGR